MPHNQAENPSGALLSHKLLDMVHGSWMAQAVYVAAELKIADLLAAGPRMSGDLAAATGAHGRSLHRLLRALTTIDICTENEDGSFAITRMGSLLASDVPGSLRYWMIWWSNYLWPVWGNLLYSVTTGKSARTLLNGTEGFDHLKQDPTAAAIFHRGLAELTAVTASGVVSAYDFSGFKRIIDVGGGYGQLLGAILKINPSSHGILFDQSHAIEGAKNYLQEAGVADRCEFVAGDFFDSIPGGADAYILKSVVHDWNRDHSLEILRNCRRAMSGDARLLLVERVIPEHLEISAAHQAVMQNDLSMLVALAAEERTEVEFRDLLNSAGFEVIQMISTGMTVSIIEASPR